MALSTKFFRQSCDDRMSSTKQTRMEMKIFLLYALTSFLCLIFYLCMLNAFLFLLVMILAVMAGAKLFDFFRGQNDVSWLNGRYDVTAFELHKQADILYRLFKDSVNSICGNGEVCKVNSFDDFYILMLIIRKFVDIAFYAIPVIIMTILLVSVVRLLFRSKPIVTSLPDSSPVQEFRLLLKERGIERDIKLHRFQSGLGANFIYISPSVLSMIRNKMFSRALFVVAHEKFHAITFDFFVMKIVSYISKPTSGFISIFVALSIFLIGNELIELWYVSLVLAILSSLLLYKAMMAPYNSYRRKIEHLADCYAHIFSGEKFVFSYAISFKGHPMSRDRNSFIDNRVSNEHNFFSLLLYLILSVVLSLCCHPVLISSTFAQVSHVPLIFKMLYITVIIERTMSCMIFKSSLSLKIFLLYFVSISSGALSFIYQGMVAVSTGHLLFDEVWGHKYWILTVLFVLSASPVCEIFARMRKR